MKKTATCRLLRAYHQGEAQVRMPADATIIPLIRAGRTQEAFEQLVPAYRRRVVGLAFSVLRDRAAAEDLAQELDRPSLN